MAKSRAQKEALLEDYKQILEDSSGFFAVDITGVPGDSITQLKLQLKREVDSNLSVIKNSVFKIALEEKDYPVESYTFTESTAVIPYSEDPTQIAKILKELQKATELLDAKFGVFANRYETGTKAMELAEIPSKEVLLGKLLGSINAPVSGFARTITGNVRDFVQVVHQISQEDEATA